jgi:hypothetical protein
MGSLDHECTVASEALGLLIEPETTSDFGSGRGLRSGGGGAASAAGLPWAGA